MRVTSGLILGAIRSLRRRVTHHLINPAPSEGSVELNPSRERGALCRDQRELARVKTLPSAERHEKITGPLKVTPLCAL